MRTMKERDMKDSFIQFWQNHSEAIVAVAARLIILSDPILSALPDPQSLTLSYGDGSH